MGGWEVCGADLCGRRFGWFENGCQADVIALNHDSRKIIEALNQVSFVMKDAKVREHDGQAVVGMI